MTEVIGRDKSFAGWLLVAVLLLAAEAQAAGPLLIAYGGHNETMIPLWVGIEKGIFRKYGLDPRVLQTRSGPIMMATLASGGVPLVWAAPGSAISTAVSGLKLTCFAVGNNRMPRELIVRKGIASLEDLRGKSFGVQSIGGGFWLQTMIILDHLGVDPDKFGLKVRVIGDGPVIAQALLTGNIDAAALTYALSEVPLKTGFRSLADAAELKAPYQGPGICALKESLASRPDFYLRLTRGLAEASAFILDSGSKADVVKILQRNLRLSKADESEASYKVLRLSTTLDLAPNPATWKAVQRIVAKINPKIAQVDLESILDSSFVRNLEASGFLAEQRKKVK